MSKVVSIDYTNWRGERRVRQIKPWRISLENNEWHPDTQWLLYATDIEDGKMKTFAMKDIHSWAPGET